MVMSQSIDDQVRNLCRAIDHGLRDWQGKTRVSALHPRGISTFPKGDLDVPPTARTTLHSPSLTFAPSYARTHHRCAN